MGRPRKNVAMLQANDQMPRAYDKPELVTEQLTLEQIKEALAENPNIKVSVTDKHWFLEVERKVFNSRGDVIARGTLHSQGVLAMPLKDLIYAAQELMTPISPVTPNPAA